jgi:hypothetical protein
MTSVVFMWLSKMETWLEEEVMGLLPIIPRRNLGKHLFHYCLIS